jgi:hypothetical protein
MKVEKWDGMIEGDTSPGCVWYHLTEWDGMSKHGLKFEVPRDADEEAVLVIAREKWAELMARKYPGGK